MVGGLHFLGHCAVEVLLLPLAGVDADGLAVSFEACEAAVQRVCASVQVVTRWLLWCGNARCVLMEVASRLWRSHPLPAWCSARLDLLVLLACG